MASIKDWIPWSTFSPTYLQILNEQKNIFKCPNEIAKRSEDFLQANQRKRRSQKIDFNVQIQISKKDSKRIEEECRTSKLLVKIWKEKAEVRKTNNKNKNSQYLLTQMYVMTKM